MEGLRQYRIRKVRGCEGNYWVCFRIRVNSKMDVITKDVLRGKKRFCS